MAMISPNAFANKIKINFKLFLYVKKHKIKSLKFDHQPEVKSATIFFYVKKKLNFYCQCPSGWLKFRQRPAGGVENSRDTQEKLRLHV